MEAVMETSQRWDMYSAVTSLSGDQWPESIYDLAHRGDLAGLVKRNLTLRELNTRSANGQTVLMIAAVGGYFDLTKYLLEQGVDPNVVDFGGNTVLMDLVFTGDLEMAKLLLKYGADVNHHNLRDLTARDFAEMFQRQELLRLLNDGYVDKGQFFV